MGGEEISYLRFAFSFLFVIGLIGIFAIVLRKFYAERGVLRGSQRRIKVCESLLIDSKRKIALIQVDDTEHLILFGSDSDKVISSQKAREN